MGTNATLDLSTTPQTYGTALSITAPAAGFVMIHGGTTVRNVSWTSGCEVVGQVRQIQSDALSEPAIASMPFTAFTSANLSHAWVFPVDAGVNTFDIRLYRGSGNGPLEGWFVELAAIYSPFGFTGTGTLGTAAAETASADATVKAAAEQE